MRLSTVVVFPSEATGTPSTATITSPTASPAACAPLSGSTPTMRSPAGTVSIWTPMPAAGAVEAEAGPAGRECDRHRRAPAIGACRRELLGLARVAGREHLERERAR